MIESSDPLDDVIAEGQRINSPLQELSTSDLENSMEVREKYGLLDTSKGSSNDIQADSFKLYRLLETVARRFMDDLVSGKGGVVEDSDDNLKTFVSALDFAFAHGLKTSKAINDVWSSCINSKSFLEIMAKQTRSPDIISNAKSCIDNVKGFSLLRTGLPKLRAWIRLSLMNKTFGPALRGLLGNEKFR